MFNFVSSPAGGESPHMAFLLGLAGQRLVSFGPRGVLGSFLFAEQRTEHWQ